jgi:hypothetical protein
MRNTTNQPENLTRLKVESNNEMMISIANPSILAGVGGMSEFSTVIGFEDHRKLGISLINVLSLVLSVIVYNQLSVTEGFWARTSRR